MDNFSDWLNEKLRDEGISQRELARRAGVSRTPISNASNGRKTPTWEIAYAISRGLGESCIDAFIHAGLTTVAEVREAIATSELLQEEEADKELARILNGLDDTDRQLLLRIAHSFEFYERKG